MSSTPDAKQNWEETKLDQLSILVRSRADRLYINMTSMIIAIVWSPPDQKSSTSAHAIRDGAKIGAQKDTYMAVIIERKPSVLGLGHVGWASGECAHAGERGAPHTTRMFLVQDVAQKPRGTR
jgi:hypothetical protein